MINACCYCLTYFILIMVMNRNAARVHSCFANELQYCAHAYTQCYLGNLKM